jgi:hypothetical protein
LISCKFIAINNFRVFKAGHTVACFNNSDFT